MLGWDRPYYRSLKGLTTRKDLKPLLTYPVEVYALFKHYTFHEGVLIAHGEPAIFLRFPTGPTGLSRHELYALFAEDIRQYMAKVEDKRVSSHFYKKLSVLEFMRSTWDSVVCAQQLVRANHFNRYGVWSPLNHKEVHAFNRFKSQVIYHPLEAAKRLKTLAGDYRAWYFGGKRPKGSLLRVDERRDAIHVSYMARALPPAPRDPEGLIALVERLTSIPPPEPTDWRSFVASYVDRWSSYRPPELYTMPSGNAALGYKRADGGHVAAVQHLVLLGYSLQRIGATDVPSLDGFYLQDGGSYLELLSQSLISRGESYLFMSPWDRLKDELPEVSFQLQSYLRTAVEYVLDKLTVVPILPIVAEEKGLKTRFPTCSLTAVNLIQQVLRRALDHIMVKDPRFSEALGGNRAMDLHGEQGPWYSQDCTAATDLHPQWLTQTVYEEVARVYPSLQPYLRYFPKLFGTKKLLLDLSEDQKKSLRPIALFTHYPKAPLLADVYVPGVRQLAHGHATKIIEIWDAWLDTLESLPGTMTTTGQMMGDPTSFPPMMLSSLYASTKTLDLIPYTKKECKRMAHKPRLNRSDVRMIGIGDDAILAYWTMSRKCLYDHYLGTVGGVLSQPKCFWHKTRGLLAEVPLEAGFPQPHLALSCLVCPPGGSKGQVMWHTQSASLKGDPSLPQFPFRKFLWKLSPHYYTWKAAFAMGLPVAAPEAFGGCNITFLPKVSQGYHVKWLRYLSQADLQSLIIGMGLSITPSGSGSLIDPKMAEWLREVIKSNNEYPILSDCSLDSQCQVRVSLEEGYRRALGTVRSAEFYFRNSVPEFTHVPSVRKAVGKFTRKVLQVKVHTKVGTYTSTKRDLDRKVGKYFTSPAGFFPSDLDGNIQRSAYGLERTSYVKERYIAPHIKGLG